MKTLLQAVLSAFLFSKPFQNNYMHCEIIDHYFNKFSVAIQLKKEKITSVFWVPKPIYWSPKKHHFYIWVQDVRSNDSVICLFTKCLAA